MKPSVIAAAAVHLLITAASYYHCAKEDILPGKLRKAAYLVASAVFPAIFLLINRKASGYDLIFMLAGLGLLIRISAGDIKSGVIDLPPTLALYLVGVLSLVRVDVRFIITRLLAALLFFVVMAIGRKLSKDGIGRGDVILMPAVGLMLGTDAGLRAAVLGLAVMAVTGLLMTLRKRIKFKDGLPLAPFILLGYVFCSV